MGQDYSAVVRRAWSKLVRDFKSGQFDPWEEADIQNYLYHLCLNELRDLKLIHSEWPYSARRGSKTKNHIDLLVGPLSKDQSSPGQESVPVEIKWCYLREWRTRPRWWGRDVKKLHKHKTKRQPVLAFFIPMQEEQWGPVLERELTNGQARILRDFKSWAKKCGVKVLLSF